MRPSLYVPLLTSEQLSTLTTYKYLGEDRSLIYNHVLNPQYIRLANHLPLWLAPNAVTLIGFLCPVATHLALLYHVPHLDTSAPRYLYLLAGLSLLFYMVMDNLDGKQARRTGSSSPLGHLFDHGCDALNVTVSGLSLLIVVQLYTPSIAFAMLYGLGFLMFYTATLEELHTGALVLRELNGPTEGLLFLAGIHIATAWIGPRLWTAPLQDLLPLAVIHTMPILAEARLNVILAGVALGPTIGAMIPNLMAIASQCRLAGMTSLQIVRRVGLQLFPVILLGMGLVSWAVFASESARQQLVVASWLAGLAAYDAITRIMLVRLARTPFCYTPPALMAFAGVVIAEVGAEKWNGMSWWREMNGAVVVLGGVLVGMMWRTWCVVVQMCEFLGTRCLSLQPVEKKSR